MLAVGFGKDKISGYLFYSSLNVMELSFQNNVLTVHFGFQIFNPLKLSICFYSICIPYIQSFPPIFPEWGRKTNKTRDCSIINRTLMQGSQDQQIPHSKQVSFYFLDCDCCQSGKKSFPKLMPKLGTIVSPCCKL